MTPPITHRVRLTYDDYLLFPNDGKRHEIIDGELAVSPAPSIVHQTILLRLTVALHQYLTAHPIGRVFFAPVDVILDPQNIVQPDAVFVSLDRQAIITQANLQGAPSLVIEVLSPDSARRDRIEKRYLYERFGVQEYWVVDVDQALVEVYRRQADTLPIVQTLRAQDTLTSPILPAFSLALADLLIQA